MENIEKLQDQISKAQKWALEHFNAKHANENPFYTNEKGEMKMQRASCFVKFPDVLAMTVNPSTMGQPSFITFHYKLHIYESGKLVWCAKNPGVDLPDLIVS